MRDVRVSKLVFVGTYIVLQKKKRDRIMVIVEITLDGPISRAAWERLCPVNE